MSDTTNTLAEQLVEETAKALFRVANPTPFQTANAEEWSVEARAAVVAVLRTLRDATDDIGPVFAKLQRGFIDDLADEVESQS